MVNFLKNIFRQDFIRGSAALFAGSMIGSLLNYVFHLVIGRMVSVEIYGEAESLISLVTIISVPAATVGMVAAKYAASCKADNNPAGNREMWKYLSKKVFVFGLPIFIAALLLTPLIGRFLNINNNFAFVLVWVTMFLSFVGSVNAGTLNGWQKFGQASLVGIWGVAAKLLFGVLLVWAGFSLAGIIGGFALGSLVSFVVSIAALKFIFTKKSENGKKNCGGKIGFQSIRNYVMPVFVGNVAITALGNADMVLAKRNLDDLAAGQYGALMIVGKIIFFATGIVGTVLFSMAAENSHKGESSSHILKKAVFFVSLACVVAVIIYFIAPKLVLGVLFGSKYQSVSSYLGWFAVSASLFSISNLIFQYLLSIHQTKISYVLAAVAAAAALFVFLYGESIYAILVLTIISQVASIIAGVFFVFYKNQNLN